MVREEINYPDEIINDNDLYEGAKKTITVNSYERNPQARQRCIEHFGYKCQLCGFDFSEKYGELGDNYIHVHHIKPLADIDEKYIINPIIDLIPVCPNCHAMLHLHKPPLGTAELRNLLK